MQLARTAAVLAMAATLSACLSTEPVPARDYGFVVLVGRDGVDAPVIEQPIGYFFRSNQIAMPSGGAFSDNCQVLPFDPENTGSLLPLPGLNFVSAGEPVTVGLSGATTLLYPVPASNGTTVYVPETGNVAFTPGDTATVAVPGADGGFPAMTIRGKTAEAFAPEPVTFGPLPASDVLLSWSPPASQAGQSAMIVSLRYATAGSETLNSQIFCRLVDDGQAEVSPLLVDGWNTSTLHEVRFERERVAAAQEAGTQSVLVLLSTWYEEGSAVAAPQP